MSETPKPVTVRILDKEYTVACTDKERDSLLKSVEFLNTKIKDVRSNGKVAGSERIVVMAALNIVHEFLEYKDQNEGVTDGVKDAFMRIHGKVSEALDTKSSVN